MTDTNDVCKETNENHDHTVFCSYDNNNRYGIPFQFVYINNTL